jgi:hypothetical protein
MEGIDTIDADQKFEAAREAIERCRYRADLLLFAADEIEGRIIIQTMQAEARLLSVIAERAPARRREAELLMGECARIWTGLLTAEPWAWR